MEESEQVPVAQQDRKKPMTNEELEILARRCDYENDKMAYWYRTKFEDGFIAGWRAAEKHHGIGEKDDSSTV